MAKCLPTGVGRQTCGTPAWVQSNHPGNDVSLAQSYGCPSWQRWRSTLLPLRILACIRDRPTRTSAEILQRLVSQRRGVSTPNPNRDADQGRLQTRVENIGNRNSQ